MASLREVASRAGVSLSTASRVLSGSDYPVGSDLREAVLAAANALDYVPNAQAQTLIAGTTGAVGVLVGDVGDPYFSEIVRGIHQFATPLNLLVTICSTARDVERELAYFRMLQSHRFGLVIIGGSGLEDPAYQEALAARIAALEATGGRTVAIGNPDAAGDRVLVDNHAGAQALADHLLALGHRNVGVAAGQANLVSTIHRIAGLRSRIERAGGSLHVVHVSPDRDGGRLAADQLTSRHPEVSAIVGTADQLAIGALHWLQDHRRAVPDEISVAGFNDIPAASDVRPDLTTVRLPLREMGAAALRLGLAPRTAPAQSVAFQPELVVRGTTAQAAAMASMTETTPTISSTGTGEEPPRAKARISRQAGSK